MNFVLLYLFLIDSTMTSIFVNGKLQCYIVGNRLFVITAGLKKSDYDLAEAYCLINDLTLLVYVDGEDVVGYMFYRDREVIETYCTNTDTIYHPCYGMNQQLQREWDSFKQYQLECVTLAQSKTIEPTAKRQRLR